MANTSTLYLLCGKMAAGKSTLANRLSQLYGVVVICEDDLLAALYPGEITELSAYVEKSDRIKSAIEKTVVDLLSQGTSLILDFPANTVMQRKWLLGLADSANSNHELHYLDIPDDICKSRLQTRATQHPERAATDTVEMFDVITGYFEPPLSEEGLNIVVTKNN